MEEATGIRLKGMYSRRYGLKLRRHIQEIDVGVSRILKLQSLSTKQEDYCLVENNFW
jgi:hypothetical protein